MNIRRVTSIVAATVFAAISAPAGYDVLWEGFNSTAYNDTDFNNHYGYAWTKGWAWGSDKHNGVDRDVFHPNWNIWVDNGSMKVKAYVDSSGNYFGGATTTGYWKKYITYGIVEGRIKAPYQYGYCPAFWMIPSDGTWPPEIDIFEFPGAKSDSGKKFHFTVHWSNGGNQAWGQEIYKGGGQKWTGNWHYYKITWDSDKIECYADNSKKVTVWDGTENRVPDKQMYVVCSIEVSLGGDGWSGWPAWNTEAIMEVDHVWMYQN